MAQAQPTSDNTPDKFMATACQRGTSMSANAHFRGGSTETNISVRPEMSRQAYDSMRPGMSVPLACTQQDYRTIMVMCRAAYERVGVIRSVIDMMSEFGAEGVEIIHPDAGPNAFYQAWSRRVKLEDRAERFLNWLYKNGNVAIRRTFAEINTSDVRKITKDMEEWDVNTEVGKLPIEYIFYDPATLELVGGGYGALSTKKMYAVRVPMSLKDGLRTPTNKLEQQIFDSLPQELQDAISGKTPATTGLLAGNGVMYIPIPEEKLYISFFKKDDSEIWGKSFIYSILDDVLYNDKLKLAKIAALDGWYNVIRLWKLGTDDRPAAPDAGQKLSTILEANTGAGAADIIWSHDINLEEFFPPIEKLSQFEENIHNILLGLGVPEGLVGGRAEGSAGMTNSFLGLKNLIKRLEAGRREVRQWIETEIDIIQETMGFKKRPVVRFANSDLYDEKTYFTLLLNLVDRNILSDETILERINELPGIEKLRVKREETSREEGVAPKKAGPFYKPELEDQQAHEKEMVKLQGKVAVQKADNSANVAKSRPKPPRGKGRPDGSSDTYKRDRKNKTSLGELTLEANKLYDFADKLVRAHINDFFEVDDVRKLTSEQDHQLDETRNQIFGSIIPFSNPNTDTAFAAHTDNQKYLLSYLSIYEDLLKDAGAEKLTSDQKRILRIQAYVSNWVLE